jgi:uncharacterized protein YcbX
MYLSALNLHPVKSLRGYPAQSIEVDDLGAIGDRRFLVVDAAGAFLTQRTFARMATVSALIDRSSLILRVAGSPDLVVRRGPDANAPLRSVKVWNTDNLQTEDCGDPAAAWLTSALGVDCRLVRAGPAFHRQVLKPLARPGEMVSFADACPFLATSEASLEDLNDRILENGGSPVTMDRFRTNLVFTGCAPYAEDTWKRFRVGEVVFRALGPSARCIVTTTDQQTGERGVEPLRTLATFRRDPVNTTCVNFGQNLVNESKTGVIRVGDPVEVLD